MNTIPNTHWQDNGDGTAWVVLDAGRMADFTHDVDRPCDTCDGEGYEWDDDDDGSYDCPDCDCTGRPTFEVEVECVNYGDTHIGSAKSGTGRCENGGCAGGVATLRVHVVPGTVLQLLDGDVKRDEYPTDAIYHSAGVGWWRDSDYERIITLPDAAKPGMWAVLLEVHS
jgi:hypothetical protein